jgi:hypothetical protein
MVRYRGYRFEAGGRRQEAGGTYLIILKKAVNCLKKRKESRT